MREVRRGTCKGVGAPGASGLKSLPFPSPLKGGTGVEGRGSVLDVCCCWRC